jgi:hypothetical protein
MRKVIPAQNKNPKLTTIRVFVLLLNYLVSLKSKQDEEKVQHVPVGHQTSQRRLTI